MKPVRRARISHQGVETGPPPPLWQAVTPENWQQVVERAVADSLCDDPRTRGFGRRFLLHALFGEKPGALVQIANINTADPLGGGKLDAEGMERLHQIVRQVYGIDLVEASMPRGLSADEAKFWRDQVLLGMGAQRLPEPTPALPQPAPVPADYAAVTPPSQPIEGEMIDADEAAPNAPGD